MHQAVTTFALADATPGFITDYRAPLRMNLLNALLSKVMMGSGWLYLPAVLFVQPLSFTLASL